MNRVDKLRPVVGFPGYLISQRGELYSQHSRINLGYRYGRRGTIDGRQRKLLAATVDRYGYLKVTVHAGLKSFNRTIHRLVAEAWIGPPPFVGAQIRHLDNDKSNNDYRNLAWGTAQENADDNVRAGKTKRGASNAQAKLNDQAVREIRRRRDAGESNSSLARLFGVTEAMIRHIAKRTAWKHVVDVEVTP